MSDPITPTTPTEGVVPAAPENLLSSSDPVVPPQQPSDPATPPTDPPAPPEPPAGAPESYDFKAPEGKEYDSAVLAPFSEAAKEANLTQEAAQKLLDTMAPKLAERQQAQVEAVRTGWIESSKTDKDFGGDKLQESLATAKKALDTFAPKNADGTVSGFRKLLDDTGLGNHPEVIRFMVGVGKNLSEDGFVAGRAAPPGGKSTAETLYNNTK